MHWDTKLLDSVSVFFLLTSTNDYLLLRSGRLKLIFASIFAGTGSGGNIRTFDIHIPSLQTSDAAVSPRCGSICCQSIEFHQTHSF